ncbi:MAG: hypothetical protein V4710_21630 [Verrucomicrobiota bacterium]
MEREHRRRDQLARHEIRVGAHLDALLLTAEPAWRVKVSYMQAHQQHTVSALFIPRTRRWLIEPA